MKKSFIMLSLLCIIASTFTGCNKKKSAQRNKNSELISSSDFSKEIENNKQADGDMESVLDESTTGDTTASPGFSGAKSNQKFKTKSYGSNKAKTTYSLDDDVMDYKTNSKKSSGVNSSTSPSAKVVVPSKKAKSSGVTTFSQSQITKSQPPTTAANSDTSSKSVTAQKSAEKGAEKKPVEKTSSSSLTDEDIKDFKKLAAAFKSIEAEKNNKSAAPPAEPSQSVNSNSKNFDSSQEQKKYKSEFNSAVTSSSSKPSHSEFTSAVAVDNVNFSE